MVVTIGDVTGVNTTLSVKIVGEGTIAADPPEVGVGVYTDFSGTLVYSNSYFMISSSGWNNMGDYVDDTYATHIGERFTAAITVNNLTDETTANAQWLYIDHDFPPSAPDDFGVLLDDAGDGFLEVGDEWSVSGTTTMVLQVGNAGDFNLGTYSWNDNGANQLIIQEASAVAAVPEPATLAIWSLLGGIWIVAMIGKWMKCGERPPTLAKTSAA